MTAALKTKGLTHSRAKKSWSSRHNDWAESRNDYGVVRARGGQRYENRTLVQFNNSISKGSEMKVL